MGTAALHCRSCATPRLAQDTSCVHCGLIFASVSQLPPAPVAVRALRAGQLLDRGRYMVVQPLTEGGMGALYLAHDLQTFGRPVVIKTLPPDQADPGAQMARAACLDGEAQRLASLHYPTFPGIISYCREGPVRYLVLEYIAGTDLLQGLSRTDGATGQRLTGRPYAAAAVIRWGITLCDALCYLALQPDSLVHGDIKPENLLLERDSQALYLIDFGAAVLMSSARSTVAASGPYGTPGYAAPEQYSGAIEPRSDVYSLAATLYHLATDDDPTEHPFQFPQLDQLGRLGEILRPALERDVALRPTAAVLGRQLATLDAPPQTLGIVTPDGGAVGDLDRLVAWCERHWASAADWLYSSLPEQIERWQGAQLAASLRRIIQSTTDRQAGLDAALALLDPDGFGSTLAVVHTSTRRIDGGRLYNQVVACWPVTLANPGRRYVNGTLSAPPWLTVVPPTIGLPPGGQVSISLQLDPKRVPRGGPFATAVAVDTAGATLARITVHATVSSPRALARRLHRRGASITVLLLLALLGGALSWLPPLSRAEDLSDRPEFWQPECLASNAARSAVVFNRDGSLAAVRDDYGYGVDVWRVNDFSHMGAIKGLPSSVTALAFDPDSTMVAIGGEDGTVRLWRVVSREIVKQIELGGSVTGLAFTPDGRALATAGVGSTIQFWPTQGDDPPETIENEEGGVLTFSPTGALFAHSQQWGSAVWRYERRDEAVLRGGAFNGCLTVAAFSPDEQSMATASADAVALYGLFPDTIVWETELRSAAVPALAFSRDGQELAVAEGREIRLIRTVDGSRRDRLIPGGDELVSALIFQPDGKLLVALGHGSRVRFEFLSHASLINRSPRVGGETPLD